MKKWNKYQFAISSFRFYVGLSWIFSTCVGLILFLIEIGIIFHFKFRAIGFEKAGWITSAILGNVFDRCHTHKSTNFSVSQFRYLLSSLLSRA